jgi:SAM-dependent methyltransferase
MVWGALVAASAGSRLVPMKGAEMPPRQMGGRAATPAAPGADSSASYAEIAASFDRYAAEEDRWRKRTGGYHDLVTRIARSLIPEGESVLEIGCGSGDLLAALKPTRGVGVDVSGAMVASARARHPDLEFLQVAGEDLDLGESFDYIVLSDVVPYADDLLRLFTAVRRHSHARTRVVVSFHSNVWRPLLAAMAALRLRPSRPVRNWITPRDLTNLFDLAGFEIVSQRQEILLPVPLGPVSRFFNGLLARLPGLRALALTSWAVARPLPEQREEMKVSVIVPCRNESGSISDLVERIPEVGAGTEIVFVEGGSEDDTRERIEAEIERRPDRDMKLVQQSGKGKWNAVQEGFGASTGGLLVILDGDMTVDPEELERVYEAIASGHGEFVNGNRLVYGMEAGAMRFLNMIGNKFFAALLSRVLGQYVKDTLCGTKAILRPDWERILRRREELGATDPFGDFELLLGSALLGLKITNLPVRYRARRYGETNIQRFSDGAMLARLVAAGFRRIWIQPVTRDGNRRQ